MRKLYTLEELKLGEVYTGNELSNIYGVVLCLDNFEVYPEENGRGTLISIDNIPPVPENKLQSGEVVTFKNFPTNLYNIRMGE